LFYNFFHNFDVEHPESKTVHETARRLAGFYRWRIRALIFSTFFEEYQWSANAVLGVIVVLIGNLVILTPAETLEKL